METPGPEETGSKRDRVVILLLILALLGGLLYARLQSNVFPTASLSLPLSRTDIVERARIFAGQHGYDGRLWPLDKADGTRKKEIESITFTTFDEAKTFLEYELGLSKAGAIMRDKVPVWAWSVRFCREFTIEQCRVWFAPDGALVGYWRTLEEERRLPSLSHQEALLMASDFLKLEGKVQEGTLKLVRDEANARVHRTDHSFTFEDRREDFHGGKLRFFVEVSGNMVTGYNRYLFVPDSWSRKYNNMRSYNELLQRIANIFYSTLQIISALVVPWALSRKQMRWRFAVFGGLTMALTGFLDSVNDFESIQAAYDTTSSYNDYLLSYFGRSGASALGSMLFGGLLFGGADVVYRHFYPQRVALENFLKPAGFFTREGVKALYIGYLVALVHLGWIVLYYLLGEKINFWCPSGIDSVEVLSATVPFYSAISLGLHAASQEETVARIVGLSLAWKATGRFWLANLFQAVIWAFMHSSYPQQPCFARGVELTVVGLFYGFILRRYGLLPCFIGHYLLDAFLDVKPLLSVGPGQLWLWLSSFLPLVPFLLILLVSIFVTRLRALQPQGAKADGAEGDAALTNEALSKSMGTASVAATPAGDGVHDVYVYKGFSRRFRLIAGISALIVLTITFFIHLPTCGDNARCQIGREQAVAKARLILQKAGVDVRNHIAVPVLSANVAMEEMQYLFEQVKRARTLELSRLTQPGLVWSVSFFRFMDPTEHRVELRADGSEYSIDLKGDDDAPGARLSEEEAKALALSYIKRVHPEYKDFKLSRLSREDEKNRRDYSLDFVVPALKVGEAEYKFYLQVVGDLPCNFAQAWSIPDSWRYERIKETKQDKIFATVRLYTKVIIVLVLLYWVFCLLRAGVIRWRLPLVVAAVLALVPVLEQINHWPSFMAQYETHLTEATYIFNRFLQLVQHSASVFWQLFLALALSLGAFKILSPRTTFGAVLTTAFRPASSGLADRLSQRQMWLDGIVVALCGEALSQLKETITYFLYYFYSPEIRGAQIDVLCSLSDYFSAVFSDVLDLPQSFLLAIAIYLIGAGMYMKFCRNFWFYMGFCLLYDLIMCSGERHWQDYLIALLSGLINSVIVWYFIAKLAKMNPVAYLLKIVLDDCLPFIYAIYAYGLPAFAPDMVAFLIYLLAPLAVLLYLGLRNRSLEREGTQQAPL